MAEDKKHGDKNFSNEAKKSFLEIVSTYNKYQEMLDRKSDISEIAETLGGITEAARMLAINEADDWFDAHTVKRNMNELEKLGKQFDKCAVDAKSLDQRLHGLYEDMGHILARYYKVGDISEDEMKQRLGMNESINERQSAAEHAEDILGNKSAPAVEISKVISTVNNRIKSIEKQAGSRKLSDEKYKLQSLLSKLEKQKAFPRQKNESINENRTIKYPTPKGTLHIEVEEDAAGVIVDVIFDKKEVAEIDIQFPSGDVVVKHKTKRVSLKEEKSPCSCGCGTCDKALTENTLLESSMAELDMMAKESKDFKEFIKEVYKEFPNLPKNKNSLKWLEDIYKTNESVNEATPDQVITDLDKAKNDLLKKVDVLIAKKKKIYSNVDIESPMSTDEKKLDKDISDLFSQINQLVLQKRSVQRKSVNEALTVTDERYFGKKGIIIMIDDNGKKTSAIFKDKKNADKYNRNKPEDLKKLLDLAKQTKYPSAIDEVVNEANQINWRDVKFGDSANVTAINKTGLIVKTYGRKFHLQFPDGTTKTYDANELKFIKNESVNESKTEREKISKSEWRKIPKFNKHIGKDGIHYVTRLTDKGTSLVPVDITEGIDENNESKMAEKLNNGNEVRFYDKLTNMEEELGTVEYRKWLNKALGGYGVDLGKDPKIKSKGEAEEALFLLSK